MPTETVGFKYSVPVGAMIAGLVMNALYIWYPQWCWRQSEKLEGKPFCDGQFRMKPQTYFFAFSAVAVLLALLWIVFKIPNPILLACLYGAIEVGLIWGTISSWRATVEFRGNELVWREGRKVEVINLSDINGVRLERGDILVDYGASTPLRVSAFHDRLTTLIAMLRYHRPVSSNA